MSDAQGDLSQARVANLVRAHASLVRDVRVVGETGSTNDDVRAALLDGHDGGLLVVADGQRAGRGSHGRLWSSPPGRDLYLSLGLRLSLPLADLPPLTLAIGLAVADVVQHACPATPVRVKWPNDVWLGDGRKCAGVLVETFASGSERTATVVGVGLNVNRTDFPVDLERSTTSLALCSGRLFDRCALLGELVAGLARRVPAFVAEGPGPTITELADRLALKGEPVRVGNCAGTLVGVASDGALLVHGPAGVEAIRSGVVERP